MTGHRSGCTRGQRDVDDVRELVLGDVREVGSDFLSGQQLYPVCMSGVDRKSGVDFGLSYRRRLVSVPVRMQYSSGNFPGRKLCSVGSPRRKWNPKYFRFCCITQNSVLHTCTVWKLRLLRKVLKKTTVYRGFSYNMKISCFRLAKKCKQLLWFIDIVICKN